jgi:twitching motility protein PilT
MAIENGAKSLEDLFDLMPKWDASDLHLKVGSPPVYRIGGTLKRTKSDPLTDEHMESLVSQILDEEQTQTLKQQGSVDVGHDIDAGRVRVNIFKQRGSISLAARLVETEIPTLKELNLPDNISRVIDYSQGLVLVCGVTGSGKSTTLASLLEMVNEKYSYHILTIEDPIEFLHEDEQCIINQREMNLDCHDWPDALRAAVREDPDVILVGEMRDVETFQAALTASETGHLVFGTLHTSSAAGTIGRILDLFPTSKHKLIRQSLAFNLKAILGQKLLPSCAETADRVPVVEFMFTTAPIRKAIERGEDSKITGLISEGEEQGMISWTKSFVDMINQGFLEKKVAKQYAPNPDQVEMALKGIDVARSSFS